MNNFLKVAYEQGKMAALQEAGLTKTALTLAPPVEFALSPLARHLGATAAGAGVGALIDEDSALEGALAGGLGGLGLYSSPALIEAAAKRLGRDRKVVARAARRARDIAPDLKGMAVVGGLGGLGGGAIGNLVDDEESYLPEFLR
jgi:hypothetical protein